MVMKKKNNIPTVLQRYRHNIKYFKQLKDVLDAHDTFKNQQMQLMRLDKIKR